MEHKNERLNSNSFMVGFLLSGRNQENFVLHTDTEFQLFPSA